MTIRAGADLGGTKIQTVVIDADHQVLGQARRPTPKDAGPAGVAEAIVEAVREAAQQAGVAVEELEGVGIGSPGTSDDAAGTVTQARNVTPDWTGSFALAPAVGEPLGGIEVRLGNDVKVGTMAEAQLGAGRGRTSLLGVFWGTGVGSGIVLDGSTWSGRGAAGEIGHMVVKMDGAHCTCGRYGCVEAYAGRKAMELHARELQKKGEHTDLFDIMEKRGREQLTSGVWQRALDRDDEMAVKLIDRAVGALAAGIASAVNLLDVEAVVIGGGLGTRLADPYVARIRERMLPHLFVDDRPPPVEPAELGDLGGAIGAALQVGTPRAEAATRAGGAATTS
ncbi:MAG TPA: ROK family protein [Gaiellales bacterium]|jgi:glucokinase|nr:ROK family protein [Gaiellales bacterium]